MQHLQILSFISHFVVIFIIKKFTQNWKNTLIASIPFMIAIAASLFYHLCMWIDAGTCIFNMHVLNRIDTCAASYLVFVFSVYLYPHETFSGLTLKGSLITFATYPHVALFVLGVEDYIIISVYGAVGVFSFLSMYRFKKKLDTSHGIDIQLCLNRIVFYGILALLSFYSTSISFTADMYWLIHAIWHLTAFAMMYYVLECQEIIYKLLVE